jgi:DNA replicative helicase MCM subunit Mcm2 (Cdc46/Mcm family)
MFSDILCVVRDTIDPVLDQRLALHVVQNHMQCHPDFAEDGVMDSEAPAYVGLTYEFAETNLIISE